MVKQLTTEEKRDILHKVNVDHKKVSEVAKEYNRSTKTIKHIIGGKTSIEKMPRRPPMSDELKEEILRFAKDNHWVHSHEIRPHLSKPVAISTINRIIREGGFICNGRKKPIRVHTEIVSPDPNTICIKKEPEESVSITHHEEEVSFNESLLEDDIKEEDEPQFYPDDSSSGEDHVVNSILYMGKIYNPDLTIGKV